MSESLVVTPAACSSQSPGYSGSDQFRRASGASRGEVTPPMTVAPAGASDSYPYTEALESFFRTSTRSFELPNERHV